MRAYDPLFITGFDTLGMMKKEKVYCAFCSHPHWVYHPQHISIKHIFYSVLLAVFFMLAFSDGAFYWKWILLSPVFLLFAELFVHLRWRMSLICHECGFDPLIYKTHPAKAAEKVRVTLERRSKDPRAYLKPPLKIPVKVITPEGKTEIIKNGDPRLTSVLRALYLHPPQNPQPTKQEREQTQHPEPVGGRAVSHPG
jgi:hypothetical protein